MKIDWFSFHPYWVRQFVKTPFMNNRDIMFPVSRIPGKYKKAVEDKSGAVVTAVMLSSTYKCLTPPVMQLAMKWVRFEVLYAAINT